MKIIFLLVTFFFISFISMGEEEKLKIEDEEDKILTQLENELPKMTKKELEEKVFSLQVENIYKERNIKRLEIIENKNNAKIDFLVDVFKAYKNGAKIHIDIILENSKHFKDFNTFEQGIKKMAQKDIQSKNYNIFSGGWHKNIKLEKMLNEKFNLYIQKAYYSYNWTSKYLETLYSVYNEEVIKVLKTKYGKDFLYNAINESSIAQPENP